MKVLLVRIEHRARTNNPVVFTVCVGAYPSSLVPAALILISVSHILSPGAVCTMHNGSLSRKRRRHTCTCTCGTGWLVAAARNNASTHPHRLCGPKAAACGHDE